MWLLQMVTRDLTGMMVNGPRELSQNSRKFQVGEI